MTLNFCVYISRAFAEKNFQKFMYDVHTNLLFLWEWWIPTILSKDLQLFPSFLASLVSTLGQNP